MMACNVEWPFEYMDGSDFCSGDDANAMALCVVDPLEYIITIGAKQLLFYPLLLKLSVCIIRSGAAPFALIYAILVKIESTPTVQLNRI